MRTKLLNLAMHENKRFFFIINAFPKGKVHKKKTEKKLTNVILNVCMPAGNSEMLVFLSVFFPTMCIFQVF